MKALSYLMHRTFMNWLRELKKNPAKFIVYIVCLIFVIFLIINSLVNKQETLVGKEYKDIRLLYLFFAGLDLIYLYTAVSSGLSKGTTFFNMADASILFPAPISPQKIMVYGLIKQLGTVLFTSLFLLFQAGNINSLFGLPGYFVIYLCVIYAINLFSTQLITLVIYVFCNQNEQRKKLVTRIAVCLSLLVVGCIAKQYQSTNEILTACYDVVGSKGFQMIPLIGWMVLFLKGLAEQQYVLSVIAVLLYVLSSAFVISCFTRAKIDYYEDVLHATEIKSTQMKNAKKGIVAEKGKARKVNEGSNGIRAGYGAKTIFYKQLAELRKTSRIPFIDTLLIIEVVGVFIYYMIAQNQYQEYIVFGVMVYISIFMTRVSRVSFEVKKPYIYLIPDLPLKKIFYASLMGFIKPFIDGILVFTVVMLRSNSDPMVCLLLGVCYGVTGAIFTSMTIVFQKLFGGQPNGFIQVMLKMMLAGILVAPGITLSVITFIVLDGSLQFAALIPYIICGVMMCFLMLLYSKDMFDVSDYRCQN